ncbi:MAG: sigma-54-dependent Fis family transcriptional regulator, partial [Bacteroidales bacterium]|nr:sigma-54-dependent Fis family transcriptional regulator [Bacteroidales bacterium]
VLEQNREISAEVLAGYLPAARGEALPIPVGENVSNSDYAADRDIIFKILLGLRQDIDGIKQEIEQLKNGGYAPSVAHAPLLIDTVEAREAEPDNIISGQSSDKQDLSIQDASKELIIQALERHGGKRKPAAAELGISERTLYRKIKEFDLE